MWKISNTVINIIKLLDDCTNLLYCLLLYFKINIYTLQFCNKKYIHFTFCNIHIYVSQFCNINSLVVKYGEYLRACYKRPIRYVYLNLSEPGCYYNGQFRVGNWTDGCEFRCSCENPETGHYICRVRYIKPLQNTENIDTQGI